MEEFIELNDSARLWTTVCGKGTPAIFLNGGPGMADYLGPVAALLDQHLRIHRYEQRGCGRSTTGGPYTLNTFLSDIEELRTHWNIQQWYVIGHSWGVDLGIAYALQYPASALGLVGLSGGRVHNDRSWKQVYDDTKHKEQRPVSAVEPNMHVNRLLNEDWKEYCRKPELLRELSELEVQTMFLYGQNDIRPSWPTEQISHLIPNSEFQQLTGADHHLWQGNPNDMRDEILRFLNRSATMR